MDVMQLTAGQADVSARGFNRRLSNKLLVLVDGRTVYLDSVGTTLWASLPVTMDEIERIEVIRGPGSAIYGADAFAGVVNIITQTPGEPGAQNVARFTVGTKGTTQGATVITGRSGDVGYRASAGYTTLGRWGREIDLDTDPYWTSTLANQDRSMETLTANGQLDWRIGDGGFASVSGGVSDGLVELYSLGALRNFYFDQRLSYARADAGYGPFYARVFVNRQGGVLGNWYEPAGTTAPLNANLDSTIADATLTSLLNSFIDMSIAAFTPIGACTIKSLTAAFLSASIRNCCTSAAFPARTIISMSWSRNCPLLGKLISPRINCRAACPKAMNNLYLSRLRNISTVEYFTSLASCSDIVEPWNYQKGFLDHAIGGFSSRHFTK